MRFVWIFTAIALGILDAVAKTFALTNLPEIQTNARIIDLILYKNPGIAFSIPLPLPLVIVLSCGILAFFVHTAIKDIRIQSHRQYFAPFVIIGALGNLIDRVVNGFTTDYILLFSRSAINISDILILFGILGFVLYNERVSRETQN